MRRAVVPRLGGELGAGSAKNSVKAKLMEGIWSGSVALSYTMCISYERANTHLDITPQKCTSIPR